MPRPSDVHDGDVASVVVKSQETGGPQVSFHAPFPMRLLQSILMGMTTTTIKVPRELRDRVQKHAAQQGVTQAVILSEALDLLDRRAFFVRLRMDVEQNPETPVEVQEREAWLGGALVGGDE